MQNNFKNVSTVNNSDCDNTSNSTTTGRGKLYRITQMSKEEYQILRKFDKNYKEPCFDFRRAFRRAVNFISAHGLTHEFTDFINANPNIGETANY